MVEKQNTRPAQRNQTRTAKAPAPEAQITAEAFNERYEKNMAAFSLWTFERIYEETERQVFEKYGARKYSSADSFRQIRKRLIRK